MFCACCRRSHTRGRLCSRQDLRIILPRRSKQLQEDSIKAMKNKKLLISCTLASVMVMLLVYVLFTIHFHYIAKPTLLSYIHSGYPDIEESDLYLSRLPMPTSNGDIVIEYSFVYNDYGETLHLTYYYRNTRPIGCYK